MIRIILESAFIAIAAIGGYKLGRKSFTRAMLEMIRKAWHERRL